MSVAPISHHTIQFTSVLIFDELENDIEKFSSLGSILLMGDLNSTTGKYSDIVCQEGNTII